MKVIFLGAVITLILVAYIRLLEHHTMFAPSRKVAATPADLGLPFEEIYFQTEDGLRLNGWLVRGSVEAGTLIFLHGNAGNIGDRLGKIDFFHQMGLNVFIFDYRGYGKSEGVPSEKGMYKDAVAAYEYLIKRSDIDAKRLAVYGASLGGAVAVDLASNHPLAVMILDSTFSSAEDMARHIFPFVPAFLIRTKLDSVGKIKKLFMPKLFIHSMEDEIVPFKFGKKLFDAAAEPKEFMEINGDHNDGFIHSHEKMKKGVEAFLIKSDLLAANTRR